MIDSFGREPFQKYIVNPLLPHLAPFSPTAITWLGLVLGVLTFPLMLLNLSLTAVLFLLFSGFCDVLDGSLARYKGQASKEGAILDLFLDRVVESCVLLGLYFFDPTRALLVLVLTLCCYLVLTSFFVVSLVEDKKSYKSFYYSSGLIERSEAFIFFSLMILLPSLFTPLCVCFIVLLLVTVFFRLKERLCVQQF